MWMPYHQCSIYVSGHHHIRFWLGFCKIDTRQMTFSKKGKDGNNTMAMPSEALPWLPWRVARQLPSDSQCTINGTLKEVWT